MAAVKTVLKRILLFPIFLLLTIIILLSVWFAFCFFDRTNPINAIPSDYSVYVRTDSLWETLEPVLDIDAVFEAFSTKELLPYRDTYLKIKSSSLRSNNFVRLLLKRKFYGAFYTNEEQDFTAVLDTGILSGITRLLPAILPYTKITEYVTCFKNHGRTYFGNDSYGYFFFYKNLIVYAKSLSMLEKNQTLNSCKSYEEQDLKLMTERLTSPVRITASEKKVLDLCSSSFDNYYFTAIAESICENKLCSMDFELTKDSIALKGRFPFSLTENLSDHPVTKLITRESKVPSLLPQFSEQIQYYTLINAGNLMEIKDGAMKIVPPEKDFQKYWDSGETAAKMLFHKSLEEILFTWTGEEFAVFGLEGKAEPVVAIEIRDEEKRKEIFDSIFSSFIINSNDSLLIDDVRLPHIETPDFINGILSALNINLPKPYYLVKDNFIYFSQSPENLITINNSLNQKERLSANINWKKVSSKQSLYSSISLFYNLERSVPFFIKGNSAISKVLKLYNIGRFDVSSKNNEITLELQAARINNENRKIIPGFPFSIPSSLDYTIYKTSEDSKAIYWIEKDGTIKKLDCMSLKEDSVTIKDVKYFCNASKTTTDVTGGTFWAVTKNGTVYLLTQNLSIIPSFPVFTDFSPSATPEAYKNGLIFTDKNNNLIKIDCEGKKEHQKLNITGTIKSPAAVCGDYIAVYAKSFPGNLILMENEKPVQTVCIDEICYGSPELILKDENLYVSLISQTGTLYLFDKNLKALNNFPKQIDDIFYINQCSTKNAVYSLSEKGILYKTDFKGITKSVEIPGLLGKEGFIKTEDYDLDGNKEIFIRGQGNLVYGFTQNLDYIETFPVNGFSNPVFMEISGDNKKECIIMTIDNYINAIETDK